MCQHEHNKAGVRPFDGFSADGESRPLDRKMVPLEFWRNASALDGLIDLFGWFDSFRQTSGDLPVCRAAHFTDGTIKAEAISNYGFGERTAFRRWENKRINPSKDLECVKATMRMAERVESLAKTKDIPLHKLNPPNGRPKRADGKDRKKAYEDEHREDRNAKRRAVRRNSCGA